MKENPQQLKKILKRIGSPPARRSRRLSELKSASQPESMSRINKSQQSDVSGNLLECYVESESMPKTPSSFQKKHRCL
ncbi:hypothetical protein HPP92_010061 [Vanilla planifolia]|uniref:Uncharacterized protein n=1 Tax=Vanilla planifolia TaxID=51239 RepID=A0A835R9S2_VANPL|nr:hypothetical protein HPP92_010156 [Vanilla planifolia]KAG0481977.1 hypothetical protein HPP92_010061 [Vanilla planifolia]